MSNISIGELILIADTDHVQCGDASAMARELLEYRKAITQPVGEVVAWNHPTEERKVDFLWLDVNVEPGTLLYAAPQLKPSGNPEQFAITHDMAMAFHNALSDGGIGHEDLEDIKIGLRAAFANCAPQLQPVSNPYTLPDEMTPEMLRAVQLNSELGAYAASNLTGAYTLFGEFWRVACRTAKAQSSRAGEKCHK